MSNNRLSSIKVIFQRGKPVRKGSLVQTVVFRSQNGKWRRKTPDYTECDIANNGKDIFKFLSGKYIIVPKEIRNGKCFYKTPYRLELAISEITERELKALRLKI